MVAGERGPSLEFWISRGRRRSLGWEFLLIFGDFWFYLVPEEPSSRSRVDSWGLVNGARRGADQLWIARAACFLCVNGGPIAVSFRFVAFHGGFPVWLD